MGGEKETWKVAAVLSMVRRLGGRDDLSARVVGDHDWRKVLVKARWSREPREIGMDLRMRESATKAHLGHEGVRLR